MSPSAIYDPKASTHVVATVPTKGPALVIGSPSTALDGKYQALVSELEQTRQVERQMLDRLVDQGMAFLFDFLMNSCLLIHIFFFFSQRHRLHRPLTLQCT
jgi:hypothetical protein